MNFKIFKVKEKNTNAPPPPPWIDNYLRSTVQGDESLFSTDNKTNIFLLLFYCNFAVQGQFRELLLWSITFHSSGDGT